MPHAGHDAGTAWGWLLVGLAVLVTVLVHAVAVGRRRIRTGRRWSPARTLAFVGGVLLVAAALSPPLARFAHADPRGHMAQHLLLGMYAPILLVLGAPVTLLLGAAAKATRRRLAALLRHPAVHVLGHPGTAATLHVGGLYLLYCTPLYRSSLESTPVHAAVTLHLLLAGCLFAWSIAGPDPAPGRPGVPTRAVVLVVAAGAHAVLAKLLVARGGALPPGAGAPTEPWESAARWMYYGGDAAEIVLAVLLFAQWYRLGRRRRPPPAAARAA